MFVDCLRVVCINMGEALLQPQRSLVNPSDSPMNINYNNNSFLDTERVPTKELKVLVADKNLLDLYKSLRSTTL